MSDSPDFSRVRSLADAKLIESPTALAEFCDSGMNVCPPLTIVKQTELPYCDATTTADVTAATSSGEKAREDLRFHLPAYTLNELKILAMSFHLCP
jgi:hypothetical protein